MRTPSFIPERSLRSSLTWRVSAAIAATLLAVLVAYQSLVIAPLSLRQSAANLGVASALVEARLSLLFDQVGRDLRIARQRTREAGSAIDDVDGLNARMIPYMTHTEAVSSALFARDDGREILVLHQSDGSWMNRVTDAKRRPGRVRKIYRDADGEILRDVEEAENYDPRDRPWYKNAIALEDGEGLAWTTPYLFFTTHEPGITASVHWFDAEGRSYVLAYDVLLRDLAMAVQRMDLSRYGLAAVLTADGMVVSAPNPARGDEATSGGLLMKPVAQIGVAPLAAAHAAWSAAGGPKEFQTSLDVEGVRWVTRVEQYPLENDELCIVTMAPTRDLLPSGSRVLSVTLPLALILLLLGALFASRLANRIVGIFEDLASRSARIGALDFSNYPSKATPWKETEALAQAQDRTRELLQEATAKLAHAKEDLEARVEERTRDLQAANKEMATFSYAVSHDLRSPLRSINGFCHLLEMDYGADWDASAKDLVSRIRANTDRMDHLIDGLLSLARLSSRTLQRERCDLSAVAEEVLAELRQSEPERDVEVEIEKIPPVLGDPALLRDMMQNLLGNAWKYTAQTKGARIRVANWEKEGERGVVVSDNGAGFDMAHATHMFSPFRRMHQDAEFPGTGVGLATVRRIVEMHGARIFAESSVGEGAAFFFTLPGGNSWAERTV